MVSWGRAFRAAGAWLIYSIVWFVTGLVLIFVGLSLLSLPFFTPPFGGPPIAPNSPLSTPSPVLGIVLIVVGAVIVSLGSIAALIKVFSEVVAEEVRSKQA